ncbi:pyridoxal phosphate-dependent transferase [Leucosporidium creatinivorum]|uniref:Pyridoxal phosphate-dependent transferase n=1 Tax=Leucosporidium creatinivorum TaxID=106004 RepID=A0A1Y2EZZ2_9BASI|nr:pyridoxal phosphate-dependent transferase [Leucosporidium creatinivorum]
MDTSTVLYQKPDAIDLSHHLSLLARERLQSPLKGMYKYFNRPGMLMLAGGLPSPAYFPFESLSGQALIPNSYKTSESNFAWIKSFFESKAPKTTTFTIPKFADDAQAIQLSTALQYGTATGLPSLATFIHDFTAKVYDPGYSNWEVLVNAGSTDAWSKICTTLLERGDGILCEEWTYPSALATAWPSGFKPVPLPMDGGGMTAEGLEDLLANWDPEARGGMSRPRLLYTVPVCQNPTGATMTAERKKAIYEIAVKYDGKSSRPPASAPLPSRQAETDAQLPRSTVIIVEDDPYYFLQAGEYSSDASSRIRPTKTETDDEFIASLVPSYLKYDYQGRVIRIDTFSKTIAPGSRLGWTTGNPLFLERLQRANESSSQSASGFTQAFVAKLLVEEWGMTGWLRWLKGLKAEYRDRRNRLVDHLLDQGHAGLDSRSSGSLTAGDAQVYELRTKDSRKRDEKGYLEEMSEKRSLAKKEEGQTLLSFVAPQGGMFVWLRVHLSNHPSYPHHSTNSLLGLLWEQIAEENVLIAPGSMFSGHDFGKEVPSPPEEAHVRELFGLSSNEQLIATAEGDGFFRLSFSTASEEEMQVAAKTIAKVVKRFFEE